MANVNKLKIDFTKPLLSLSGEPFYEHKSTPAGTSLQPITLQQFCRTTLNHVDQAQGALPVEESGHRYEILKKIMSQKQPVEMSSEDIAKIKQIAPSLGWQVEIQGAAFEMLP